MLSAEIKVPKGAPLVSVRTTSNRGFTAEELAQQCASKIVSVSETAPPAIRDQAKAFQGQVQKLVEHYLNQAIHSDRTTVYSALNDAGHADLANLLRRL